MAGSVSVIIPNYNRERLIGETLQCLLNQTRPPDEVIVVDDGSSDRSVEVVRTFGERVRLVVQENAGPAAARNHGLSLAHGELVQFFDSDDLCSLNKIEVQARALEESGADFAYGPWLQTRLGGGEASYSDLVLQRGALPARRSPLAWFLRDWVTVFQACMFRRSLLDAVGHYRTDLMPTEDSELLFRILKAGARGVHTPDCLLLYRLHDGGQISQGGIAHARRAGDWLRYVELVAAQLDGPGAQPGWRDRLAWAGVLGDARRRVADVGSSDPRGCATSPAASAAQTLLSEVRRLSRSVERRARRSDFGAAYATGPLTTDQTDLIRALGYEPVFAGPPSRRRRVTAG